MMRITLRPYAKVNLTLRVGPCRPDGYHDVATLLQSIALSDTLTLTPRRGPFALECRAPGVPTDASNLVSKAATALWRFAGRTDEPRDAHIRLEKQIPSAAGLGGGSADAAAALVGLSRLWDLRCSRRDLIQVAATLGSDVPFFLQGGAGFGTGRGEAVFPVDDVKRLGVVVIKPSFGVATAEAYRWLDEDRASGSRPAAQSATEVDLGWATGPVALANDLQGPVERRHPGIGEMVEACRRQGAIGAAMSGSGSAVFGLFSEPAARRAVRALARPDWLVLLTRTATRAEAARAVGL